MDREGLYNEAKGGYNEDKTGQYFSAISNEANLKPQDLQKVLYLEKYRFTFYGKKGETFSVYTRYYTLSPAVPDLHRRGVVSMAELNLNQIIDKLNAEFAGDIRKLVFWYDDNGDFAEDIDSGLVQLQNAKIHRLTPTNQFRTKVLLEWQDTENSYLIYAPFPKPPVSENHLEDTGAKLDGHSIPESCELRRKKRYLSEDYKLKLPIAKMGLAS